MCPFMDLSRTLRTAPITSVGVIEDPHLALRGLSKYMSVMRNSVGGWVCLRVFVFLPDGEQLMQEVGSSSQQGPPGDVQGLLPPGVRAQNRHDASVVL